MSDEVIENVLQNLPVEVTGVGTDPIEVASFRNLPRIETNRVRAGALRVVNDGILGRARKVWKIIEELGIEGWDWLRRARELEEGATEAAGFTYMEDVIAGRPIFSFPSESGLSGGFRLRYGRSRNTGLAALGIHPATIAVLQDFLAVGTQLRVERPGKAGVVTSVDTIEPPIVKLKNGSVIRVESTEEAEKIKSSIDQIIFIGDLLVAFGEFLENNKPLAPSSFSEEWWAKELYSIIEKHFAGLTDKAATTANIQLNRFKNFLTNPLTTKPTAYEAVTITTTLGAPLHPRYTYFWRAITHDEFVKLRKFLLKTEHTVEKGINKIEFTKESEVKVILEKLGVPHEVMDHRIVITEDALAVAFCLGLDKRDVNVRSIDVLQTIKELTGADIRDKAPTFIGARMGRPEKAKERTMTPPVHTLFPVGLAGGSLRDLVEATKNGMVEVEVARRKCPTCNEITYKVKCLRCGVDTLPERGCPICGRAVAGERCPSCKAVTQFSAKQVINIRKLFSDACERLNVTPPALVKGVKGLTSEMKIPEPIEKGVLRAKHELSVFKDGTVRFDVTNAPLTHFKPIEISTSTEKLKELGYSYDKRGNPLQVVEQVCELKVQDVIIPEKCVAHLIRLSRFIDGLLQKFYGLPPYYNLTKKDDLVGHLIIGLAPHTSAGVIGRIIGMTKASVCYAHPLWHAAKRRDCDGDEDAIMLVLDALINFSKTYLPSQIGGMMDAPLLITPVINPLEVDDEAHNVDIASFYPLAFYEATMRAEDPKLASRIVDIIAHRLGTPSQYEGFNYTHETSNINAGNFESIYKKLGTMTAKLNSQLALAEKIRAVNVKEVAKRVLTTHFIRDIAGNLKAFSSQKFRCMKCNTKFRRIPLQGICSNCGGEISLTVHRGGIEKYLNVASDLAEKYGIGVYYSDRISIIKDEINTLFEGDKKKQPSLTEFM